MTGPLRDATTTGVAPAVEASDVVVRYGDRTVVHDVSLRVGAGEVVSLVGPNGSGKSSLLGAIVAHPGRSRRGGRGSGRRVDGRVRVLGRDTAGYGPRELARAVGMLHQRNAAPVDMTVRELVGYGRHPHRPWYARGSARDAEVVDWALGHADLTAYADRPVARLSGGEAQRAWLATVLAQRPALLVLDEPTTYLDIAHQYEVLDLVTRLRDRLGMAVLMVLHDLNQAAAVSDRVAVLAEGRLVRAGTPADVLTPDLIRRVYGMESTVDSGPDRRPHVRLLGRSRPDPRTIHPEEETP